MNVDYFLNTYPDYYKFLWLWDVHSRYIVLGLEESSGADTGNWLKSVEKREYKKGMEEYIFDWKRYHYLKDPRFINDDKSEAPYWWNAQKVFRKVFWKRLEIGQIFFTEPDPFVRPDHKEEWLSVNETIREYYSFDDIADKKREKVPFEIDRFIPRWQVLLNLLKSKTKDSENKIILISRSPGDYHDPLEPFLKYFSNEFSMVCTENIYFQKSSKFWYKRIFFKDCDNIFIECPHLSFIWKKINNLGWEDVNGTPEIDIYAQSVIDYFNKIQ